MKVCPYCEQDYLWLCNISDLYDDAVICPECDTVWRRDEEITNRTGKSFGILMKSLGKLPDWKLIHLKQKIEI